MFIETGRLLGSIEAAGGQAFGTSVFTGISINPFDTEDIETAVAVWSESEEVALNLLKNHFLVDLFLFIPAFAFLFAKVLSATTTSLVTAPVSRLRGLARVRRPPGQRASLDQKQVRVGDSLLLLVAE